MSVACLTIYDMVKSVSAACAPRASASLEKRGGKSELLSSGGIAVALMPVAEALGRVLADAQRCRASKRRSPRHTGAC